MFSIPEYFPALSVRLTEVLDEIGVNQQMVLRRRRSYRRKETMHTISCSNVITSDYLFGSQTEGTTTTGLHSDVDYLDCLNTIDVIQDMSEWRYGKPTLLMIQDKTTAPGYCRLQVLKLGEQLPVPEDDLKDNNYTFDISGRIFMKNTLINNEGSNTVAVVKGPSIVLKESIDVKIKYNRHGPAFTYTKDGYMESDHVFAFTCKTWRHIRRPYVRHMQHQMLQEGEENGCFIVPVGHRQSEDDCLEWRISPSLQERYMMFRMNIAQIRCYVLLKMIVKHYINPFIPDCISSFHCKTTLFWCKEITSNDFWRDDNLLACIIFCLNKLLHWIVTNNCPQFLIPKENLFAGKVTPNNIHPLIKIVKDILLSNGRFLFRIPFDAIGQILMFKCTMDPEHVINVDSSYKVCSQTAATVSLHECILISEELKSIHAYITTSSDDVQAHIQNTCSIIWTLSSIQGQDNLQQEATNKLLQFLYTTLGSLMSSLSLYQGNGVPRQALCWFMCGLDSDVVSSRLKLASVLYCSGDLYNANRVLQDIEQRYDIDYVRAQCTCDDKTLICTSGYCRKVALDTNDQYTRYTVFCVRFLRSEMFCVPPALQYEMFRSTADDVPHRDELNVWMDWAVVDSLPYLYYLQYRTYRQMERREDQYRALNNLHMSIIHAFNLGHRETGWNILGTCMKLEERVEEAFYCYRQSLEKRQRNNAAKWHISCLLFRLWQNNHRINRGVCYT